MTQSKTQNLKQMTLNKAPPKPTQATQQVVEDNSAEEDDAEYYAPPKLLNILSSSPSRAAAFDSLSLGESPAAGSDAKGKGKEVYPAPSFRGVRSPDKNSAPPEEPDTAGADDSGDMDEGDILPSLPMESQGFVSWASTSVVPTALYRSPRRPQKGTATIKIGDREPVTAGESSPPHSPSKRRKIGNGPANWKGKKTSISKFSSALSRFTAPGTELPLPTMGGEGSEEGDIMDEDEDSPEAAEGDESGGEAVQDGRVEELAAEIMALDRDEQGDTEVMAPDPPTEGGASTSLPNPSPNVGPDDDPEEGKETAPQSPVSSNDEEYLEEDYIDEEQNRQQAAQKAERLLREAEEKSTQPTTKALERALRILEDSHKISTKNAVRFVPASIDKLRDRVRDLSKVASTVKCSTSSGRGGASLEERDEVAEERLNLTVTKQDFLEMQIKGQFNKGFILATRADDLFIIDQHASDEKYNFEKLQQVTIVENQRLVVPKKLDLMAVDEIVVMDHMDTFKKNGFIIEVDPEAPVGEKCKLVSLPMSKETMFGLDGTIPPPPPTRNL